VCYRPAGYLSTSRSYQVCIRSHDRLHWHCKGRIWPAPHKLSGQVREDIVWQSKIRRRSGGYLFPSPG